MKIFAGVPLWALALLALFFAIAPFGQTPHLVEKWRMLFAGTLRRPLDWFDLVLHTVPLVLLGLKLITLRPGN
jgi:hypothetical protein